MFWDTTYEDLDKKIRQLESRIGSTRCVKHAKAFGRGYGALEQIYRWAATTDPEIKRLRPNDKFIAQIKRIAKELGWRA